MPTRSRYGMGGIVKEIVNIEKYNNLPVKIIVKIFLVQIDWRLYIDPIVPKINKSYPFAKRKRLGGTKKNPPDCISYRGEWNLPDDRRDWQRLLWKNCRSLICLFYM